MTPQLFHRFPMMRIDRVLAVDPGTSARALVAVSGSDAMLRGFPFYPPALLVEAIAQVAALYAEEEERTQSGFLAALSGFAFGEPVPWGSVLEVSSRYAGRFGRLVRAAGEAKVAGRLAASGEITIAL